MEVAVREAKQWAGHHESKAKSDAKKGSKGVIADNYHKEVGVVIGESTPTMETAWCASFVNYCLKDSGHSYTKDPSSQFASTSKKFVKIERPVFGAIVVYKHTIKKYGTGHTGFVYAKINDGDYAILGGNQGESITLNPHKGVYLDMLKCRLVGFYVPIEYQKRAEEILANDGDLILERSMKDLKTYLGDGTGNEAKTT
ncbi:MAG: TIGR02594 family protein [Selenomonadaceae bacterium]